MNPMSEPLRRIGTLGLIPVVELAAAAPAVALAQALAEGGLPIIEITLRSAAASEALRRIAGEAPQVLLGAGTVRTPEQVDAAAAAGARFLVAPGFNARVVARARERDLTMIPGVCTPSEVEHACEAGLRVLKFFPAEACGGAGALAALAGPYPEVRFMPTGGISPANARRYLALDNVIACGGSWLADRRLIAARDFAAISVRAREGCDLVRAVRER